MERRLTGRYNIPLRALVSFSDDPTQEFKTRNISAGGVLFITNETKPSGTRVFMSLFPDAMPGKRTREKTGVKIEGTVKRCSSTGMAVCFDDDSRFAKSAEMSNFGLTLVENLLRVKPH